MVSWDGAFLGVCGLHHLDSFPNHLEIAEEGERFEVVQNAITAVTRRLLASRA